MSLALIFDMDGVLVDSNPVHRESWAAYNLKFGIETDESMMERMYGKRNEEIVRDFFGPEVTEEEAVAHGAAKERLYREMMGPRLGKSLVPGVKEFIQRHRGVYRLGLATNAEPANVDFVLDGAGLRGCFGAVVHGARVSRPKPDPEVFLRAAEELQTPARDCVIFEDSHAGVAAARAAGARVVGVRTTHREFAGVDLAVDDFLSPELERWLACQQRR